MYIMPQGQNLAPKVKELEKRVEMLENALKDIKSEKPRMGRPPKERNDQANQQEASASLGA